jgi:hypothetical protein
MRHFNRELAKLKRNRGYSLVKNTFFFFFPFLPISHYRCVNPYVDFYCHLGDDAGVFAWFLADVQFGTVAVMY